MELLKEPLHFQWDAGNKEKNLKKHGVTNEECEEAFFDPHKRILPVAQSAVGELRYLVVGRTRHGRLLFVVFTLRQHAIRVISARDLNKKECRLYEETA